MSKYANKQITYFILFFQYGNCRPTFLYFIYIANKSNFELLLTLSWDIRVHLLGFGVAVERVLTNLDTDSAALTTYKDSQKSYVIPTSQPRSWYCMSSIDISAAFLVWIIDDRQLLPLMLFDNIPGVSISAFILHHANIFEFMFPEVTLRQRVDFQSRLL